MEEPQGMMRVMHTASTSAKMGGTCICVELKEDCDRMDGALDEAL